MKRDIAFVWKASRLLIIVCIDHNAKFNCHILILMLCVYYYLYFWCFILLYRLPLMLKKY